MKIEVVSGSPRVDSMTFNLAKFLCKQLQKTTEYDVNLLDVRTFPLPPIQRVFSSIEDTPQEYKVLAERIINADAFLIVTPEYNGSYSPALKNLFDHFPMQSNKPFGIAAASPGGMGGMRAALQMQSFISAFFGIYSPHMLIAPKMHEKFNASGELIQDSFQISIDKFLAEFIWLTEKLVLKSEDIELV